MYKIITEVLTNNPENFLVIKDTQGNIHNVKEFYVEGNNYYLIYIDNLTEFSAWLENNEVKLLEDFTDSFKWLEYTLDSYYEYKEK